MAPANQPADTSNHQSRVLVVDDDERLLTALKRGLSLSGFEVALARDPGQALPVVQSRWAGVIVLDIMMPGMDGLTFCQVVREKTDTPILMLTARDSVPDRVAGLNAGADDYLVKPFDFDELVARIRALVRRTQPAALARDPLSFADVRLDPHTWQATRGGQSLPLTAKEFRLLEYFMLLPGQVLGRDAILTSVWGPEWLETRSNVVDVHVANLRQKLEEDGRSRLIQTVRAVGYMLKVE